jgi:hypothetical protein
LTPRRFVSCQLLIKNIDTLLVYRCHREPPKSQRSMRTGSYRPA